ncbi:MAG: helix-turn-helix transcriptional regulator [Akkermansia sp.]|nr:helix-turn-helix transcriptional regulator [Akkermansia sp.]
MHTDATILQRIGSRLKELRQSQKITQQKLSERCRVHRKFISMVERGRHNVSILTLCQIINALGQDFTTFIRELERDLKK